MDINVFSPFRNYAFFDVERTLHWCHDTIDFALSYYRRIKKEPIRYDDFIRNLTDALVLRSLLYGALAAEGTIKSPETFDQIYDADQFPQYLDAVLDGMTEYFEPPSTTDTLDDDLSEDWPETRQQQESKDPKETDFSDLLIFLRKNGFTVAEIGQMTRRGMMAFIFAKLGMKDTDWIHNGEI